MAVVTLLAYIYTAVVTLLAGLYRYTVTTRRYPLYRYRVTSPSLPVVTLICLHRYHLVVTALYGRRYTSRR